MNKNLLIVGAGIYGIVASEIAQDMGVFDKIDFVDDDKDFAPNGVKVIGKISDLDELNCHYSHIIVAVGNPKIRLLLLKKIEEEMSFSIATLVSPKSSISPSAQIMKGAIVEPMAVIHAMSSISSGCIISAGAVVNHASMCCEGVHVDCNATVAGATVVPAGATVKSGEVYDRKSIDVNDFFFDYGVWAKKSDEMKQPDAPTSISEKHTALMM